MAGKNSSIANDPSPESGDRDFVITRIFDAPRSLVFQAWTDPVRLVQWWGPRGVTNSISKMEVRPGGAYRIVMRMPDGVEYPMSGVYLEIAAPERLVMSMDCSEHPAAWHDMVDPKRTSDQINPAGELLQTVTFDDLGGKTKLTIRTRFESTAIRDAMLKMGMTEGWGQSLERLASLLSGG